MRAPRLTLTQRRYLEFPLLVVLLLVLQGMQISFIQLPAMTGSVPLLFVLGVYIAYTRSWKKLAVLSCFLVLFELGASGVTSGILIAAFLWSLFGARAFVAQLALEGRPSFIVLCLNAFLFFRIFTWFVLAARGHAPPIGDAVSGLLLMLPFVLFLAYLMFPLCLLWDEIFGHVPDDSRDLTPGELR